MEMRVHSMQPPPSDMAPRPPDDMYQVYLGTQGERPSEYVARVLMMVCDVSEDKSAPLVLINPKIVEGHGSTETQEGCLSVPGFYETVVRPEQILVEAVNRAGEPFQLEADGLLAVCIQHEIDHLDGKLFVDYLSPTKRQMIRKKLLKLQKLNA